MKIMSVLRKLKRDLSVPVFLAGESAIDNIKRKDSSFVEVIVQNIAMDKIAAYLTKHYSPKKILELKDEIHVEENGVCVLIRSPYGNESVPTPSAPLRSDATHYGLSVLPIYISLGAANPKIIEFGGALNDLKARQVHAIGKANEAVTNKPEVTVQAIRLAAKYNLKVDASLIKAIRRNSELVKTVSVDEIRRTLETVLLSRKPSKFFHLMDSCGILNRVLPELAMCKGVAQMAKYHKHDVLDHCLIACDAAPKDLVLRWAALLHDVGKAVTKGKKNKNGSSTVTFYNHEVAGSKIAMHVLGRLNYNRATAVKISQLIYQHMYNYVGTQWSESAIKRFINRVGLEEKDLKNLSEFPLFMLRRADRVASGKTNMKQVSNTQIMFEKRIHEELAAMKELTTKSLDIDGNVLIEHFNLKEGPTIGHVLRHLLEKVKESADRNNREWLLEESKRYLSSALK